MSAAHSPLVEPDVQISRIRQSWLLHRFRHRLSCGCPSFRSGILIQAAFSSSSRSMLTVRPLGSTGVTPLLRYYGPLRLPAGPLPRLCLPSVRWSLSLPPDRVSQAPRLLFPRALSPTTPEAPMAARACLFTIGQSGFILVGGLATFVFLTRPNRVHSITARVFASPVARTPLRQSPLVWLHAVQAFTW